MCYIARVSRPICLVQAVWVEGLVEELCDLLMNSRWDRAEEYVNSHVAACTAQRSRGPAAGFSALHVVAHRPSPEWLQRLLTA